MRKALIFGLTLAAALSLAACGKPRTDPPEPDPAAVPAPADVSVPTPPADPAPPADTGPAPGELPGDGSDHDAPPADDTDAASVSAGAEVNPEEAEPEPPDPPQPPPEDGGEDAPAQQPAPAEEEPQQPEPAGSSDNKAGGSAVDEKLIALIQAYLSGQREGDQQSGAGGNPTDFSGSLGAYQEYLDQIRNPGELRETAETLFPGVSDFDIDWDAAWQILENNRSG